MDAVGIKRQGEHNPVMTRRFGTDPCALVYDGKVCLYMTGDDVWKVAEMLEDCHSNGMIVCRRSRKWNADRTPASFLDIEDAPFCPMLPERAQKTVITCPAVILVGEHDRTGEAVL